MKAAYRKQFLFSIAGLFIVVLMIQARFDDPAFAKNQIAFSKHVASVVGTDLQGDALEDEDCFCNHFDQLPALSFEIITRTQLHTEEVVQQSDFLPRKPIILISCLRI